MARPLRIHVPGVPLHVMSRGNGKQPIFINRADYQHFLELLAASAKRFRVDCHSYALMPNHYHLMLRPSAFPISRMMQQLNGSYAQYFNLTHQHVGHVLHGRFKALMVEGDVYVLTLLRYVMRNPVEAGLSNTPATWPWSSYRATAGAVRVPSFLTLEPIWTMFDAADSGRAQRRFAEFIALREGSATLLSALFFGSSEFGTMLSPKLEPTRDDREFTYAERFADRPALDVLLTNGQDAQQRARAIQDAFCRHGYTLREIGEVLGCHPSTVWRRLKSGPQLPTGISKLLDSLRAYRANGTNGRRHDAIQPS